MITTAELVREIKRRNPSMTLEDVARICGISKQAVHQHLRKTEAEGSRPYPEGECREPLGMDGRCRVCGWNANTRSYEPV